ncbi:NUDIX hydrolase [Streptomyces sp. SAI-090]|uniref:NUDIX hydrolase n=1 Tax=Streptomyces sp. SAI-090 TaxID=2940545 RepID=UPI0024754402|nr:NUDIX hydrolase [Streptomyces sp. SAI-090]MDH6522383.1 ADP-ribose pyrophosphatase YjhB (NUDIX family) [Streptomyces sp. SAI-090]
MSDAPKPGDPGRDAYLAEGNAKQSRKRVVADALVRDQHGRVLLVDPTYKDGWDLPGGMSENNEEPTITLRRELTEELGLDDLGIRGLLCVDWVRPHGPWDDLLAFIFDCGVLSYEHVEELTVRDDELRAFQFFPPAEALSALPERQRARAAQAFEVLGDGIPRYLKNGVPVWPPLASPE